MIGPKISVQHDRLDQVIPTSQHHLYRLFFHCALLSIKSSWIPTSKRFHVFHYNIFSCDFRFTCSYYGFINMDRDIYPTLSKLLLFLSSSLYMCAVMLLCPRLAKYGFLVLPSSRIRKLKPKMLIK